MLVHRLCQFGSRAALLSAGVKQPIDCKLKNLADSRQVAALWTCARSKCQSSRKQYCWRTQQVLQNATVEGTVVRSLVGEGAVAEARQRFFSGHQLPDGLVAEPILRSWLRCAEQG